MSHAEVFSERAPGQNEGGIANSDNEDKVQDVKVRDFQE